MDSTGGRHSSLNFFAGMRSRSMPISEILSRYLYFTLPSRFRCNLRASEAQPLLFQSPFKLRQSSNMAASNFVTSSAHTLYKCLFEWNKSCTCQTLDSIPCNFSTKSYHHVSNNHFIELRLVTNNTLPSVFKRVGQSYILVDVNQRKVVE